MKLGTTAVGFVFLCLAGGALGQKDSPLNSIDIRVSEEMVAAASKILKSTSTGTPQQGDDFFNAFLGTDGVTNNVEKLEKCARNSWITPRQRAILVNIFWDTIFGSVLGLAF